MALFAAKIVLGGVAGGALITCAAPAALGLVGFGTAGVTAGSWAAGMQSAWYGGNVVAGSAFAIAQSIGAGGAIGTGVTATAGAVSAGVAAVGAAVVAAL